MADPGFLLTGAFALRNTFGWIQSVSKGFIPFEDQIGQRRESDRFQESTYGKSIPLIYGPNNRIVGNVIYYTGIGEKRNQIKHTNGTFGSSSYTIWYTYYVREIVIALGGPINNVKRIWANGKVIWTNASITTIPDAGWVNSPSGRAFSTIALFRGSDTQNRPAMIADTTKPAYRGISYVGLQTTWLEEFGGSVPNFEFEVDAGDHSVGDVIDDVCTRSGMLASEFQIDEALYDYPVDGFIVSRQSTASDVIRSLAEVYPFDIVETPARIIFKPKAQIVVASIDRDHFGANSMRASNDVTFETSRNSGFDLPKVVSVTYLDAARDYEKNTQIAQRSEGLSTSKVEKTFQLTMTSDLARKIADRMLWEPAIERIKASVRVSTSYDFILPGNHVGVLVGDAWVNFRVDRKTLGANGILEFDLTAADPSIYDGSTAGEESAIVPNEEVTQTDFDTYLFNAPFLENGGTDSAASWIPSSGNEAWQGGQLYRSTDGGSTFYEAGTAMARGVTGTVTNAIGNANPDYWDRVNTITVELDYDAHELVSLQETSVMNGQNRIWVGAQDGSTGEVIGFATATLVTSSPRVYTLSNLLRGQRATEYATSTHTSNERFVLVTDQIIQSFNYGYSDIGREWQYKAVPSYSEESEIATTFDFTNTGERAKPRAPVHGSGTRDSSNNLSISWVRRTRLFPPGIGYGPVELDESSESYQIDIYSAGFAAVVRTISTATASASYTAAEQTADGLTPGSAVNVRIYQLSANVGRGHAGTFTV